MKKNYTQKGQSLVELLVAIAVMAIILPAILTGFVSSNDNKAQQTQRLVGVPLLKEAEEATRVFRSANWTAFAVNGTYHPAIAGSTWVLSPGSETINGYTRSVVISDVYRDASGSIVSVGGTIDPSTKKIVATVSWTKPYASSASSTFYLTRYIGNSTLVDTSYADFNAGIKSNVVIASASGGEVQLGPIGGADWCNPNLSITALDLPKSGVANAISAIEGHVFAGTGDNSSGVSYASVNISNTNPPLATISGTANGYKTNDLFGEAGYAYIATDNNAKEVVILNLSTPPTYSEIGYFDAPGNGNGNSVFVSGNIGFMTSGTKLYAFDLSSKVGSRPQLGVVTLAGQGMSIYVVGSYVYVAVAGTTVELQIVQVSPDGKTLTIVGQADVNGQAGKKVFVNSDGTRAYIATDVSATEKDFFIIDTSTKTGNRNVIGSYNSNGMAPKGITAVSKYGISRGVLVGTGGLEYQVIDLYDETHPASCGGINIDTGINGLSSVIEADNDVFSYIITGDASSELKIIAGGFGNEFTQSGIFESKTFDALNTVTFNRFSATIASPSATNLKYQVAVADANQATGSCTGATFSYVGPDLTSGTYFATSSAIPLSTTGTYKNPARCFRYKAFFSTTDITKSPILYDMTVNYSP